MVSNKKKILFVTTVDLVGESGGTRYSKSILNAFVSQYELTVLILAHSQRFQSRKLRWLLALLKSLYTWIPPNVLFHSGVISEGARKIIARPWDVIFVDHLESGYTLRYNQAADSVYVSHNREAELINIKMSQAPKWARRFLSAWVEQFEEKLANSVDGVISISSVEAEWYRTLSQNVQVIYPVFEVTSPKKQRIEEDRLRIGFLGSAAWLPNAEALGVLVEQILPYTHREIELILGGGAWDAEKNNRMLMGIAPHIVIRALGYVPDIKLFWSAIDVFVAPITSGAGVNVKVCEAIANQVPVIALPHAVRGIDEKCLAGVIVAINPLMFAKAIQTFERGGDLPQLPEEFSLSCATRRLENLLIGIKTGRKG